MWTGCKGEFTYFSWLRQPGEQRRHRFVEPTKRISKAKIVVACFLRQEQARRKLEQEQQQQRKQKEQAQLEEQQTTGVDVDGVGAAVVARSRKKRSRSADKSWSSWRRRNRLPKKQNEPQTMAKNVCQLLRGTENGRGIKTAAEAFVSHYSLATPH